MIEQVCLSLQEYQKLKRALELALDSLRRIESMGTNTNLDIPNDYKMSSEAFDAKMTLEFILRGNF